jgi:hypothetical protein
MVEAIRHNEEGFGGHRLSEFGSEHNPTITERKPNAACSTRKRDKTFRFIKGPIDLVWISKACRVKASELALYLHYKAGILGVTAIIQIRPSECLEFGLSDRLRQRQVDRLSDAGLITAEKGNGKCPRVKLVL